MCGICGVYCVSRDERIDADALETMKDLLTHRGPDEHGSHIEPQAALGHRRLSIIGVTTGRQPLSNETGSVWVSFNGEIYNYRELRRELLARGHEFKTTTDTEVLVHLYEEEGVRFVERLRGMFAIALWDRKRRKLVLARDRLGKKPLYYYADSRRLVFASEIKAVLAYPGTPRTPNLEALHHYLSLAYVPAPLTAFQGISSLPAGHVLEAEDGTTRVRRYWTLEFSPRQRTMAELEEELDAAFDEAVRVRLESEVPLGVFLSGGIDSSAVAHRMTLHASRRLVSTTIRFADPRYDESAAAEHLARTLGTEHHVREVGPGSADVIDRILWHFDEPFADASALPTYYLCQAARESLTVALSGDGGDEMFAGYDRYVELAREESLRRWIPAVLRKLVAPLVRIYPRHWRGRTLLENLNLTPAEAACNSFVHFDRKDKRGLYTGELKKYLVEQFETERLLHALHDECSARDPISRAMCADYRSYLVDDILVKVDRMSMAHSLEVRSPLLDHRLVELVAAFPPEAKLGERGTKTIFKRMLSRYLPEEVLDRPKRGFAVPLAHWFRGDLKELVEDVLFDGTLQRRGYFEKSFLDSLWRLQQSGGGGTVDLGTHFWILLLFELWHRTYIDRKDFLRASAVSAR